MRKSLKIAVLLAVVATIHSQDDCEPGYWKCKNGKCIIEDYYCDSSNDCGDASDEPDGCSHCEAHTWLCAKSNNCIPIAFLCDGVDDCANNSDEIDEFTGKCPGCPANYFQCTNGRCILEDRTCDQVNDCKDGSDEDVPCPPCEPEQFRCKNGQCMDPYRVCDTWYDCEDYSDEITFNGTCPECPADSFKCPESNKCLYHRQTCDGNNDCENWGDETEESCPCADDEYRCIKQEGAGPAGSCIPPSLICDLDGICDCPFCDDEANCSKPLLNEQQRKERRESQTLARATLQKRKSANANSRTFRARSKANVLPKLKKSLTRV